MSTSLKLDVTLMTDKQEFAHTTFNEAVEKLAAAVSDDYLAGLKLIRASTTQLTVGKGQAMIPSTKTIIVVESDITVTPTLVANTMYHVYLYNSATLPTVTPAIEVVTTAPEAYFGMGWQKAGAASRRYLGSIRTNASSQIMNFRMVGNDKIRYLHRTNTAPLRALTAGAATTETNVSLAGLVSPTSLEAKVRLAEVGNVGGSIGTSDDSDSAIFDIDPSGRVIGEITLTPTQTFSYYMNSGGTLYVDVLGYTFER